MNPNPSFSSADSPAPDALFAGEFPRETETVTIKSGASLVRGTVLGRILTGSATSAPKTGGNTGAGTCTVDGTTPVLAGAKPGVYTVRCISTASNAGKFEVRDPDGVALGTVDVGSTFANRIKFALADVSTDFAVGDGFDITVAAGSRKFVTSLTAAIDGSQIPCAILVNDVDATSEDKTAAVYRSGDFNPDALTFGTGHSKTAAATIDALRACNIHLKAVVAA